jgi:hypothetical protein
MKNFANVPLSIVFYFSIVFIVKKSEGERETILKGQLLLVDETLKPLWKMRLPFSK